MLKSPSTKIKCRSLPEIPASELRTRTQLDEGRGWRGRFCTCRGEKEEKYAPRQKVPRIFVGMTCVRSSCRVEVHMVSSIGVPSMLGSFLTFHVSFHFISSQCTMHVEVGQSSRRIWGLLTGTWQFYGEYRLCIGCAEHRDFSLVRAYYCLGNSKTETRARRRRFHFIISGNMLTSIETLKDMRKIVWMNTFAVINDLHQRMTILSVKLEFNPAFRGRTAVFEGIIK